MELKIELKIHFLKFTLKFLINCLSRIFPEFKFKWLAEETAKNLPIELDFINEAKNIEEVAKLFQDHKFVKVSLHVL